LLADQRQRWEQGRRILVESYLAQFPSLGTDQEAVLDLIYNEVYLREQHGEPADLAEYVQRFPQWTAELRLQFEVHQAIQTSSAPATMPVTGAVPGYDLLDEIGRGGMGVVYRARRQADGELFAVKLLLPERLPNRPARKRFLAEIQAVAALAHPHVVKVWHTGEGNAGPFYVMELLDGLSLHEIIRQAEVDVGWAVQTMIAVAEPIEHAHSLGILHRDLKPANILMVKQRGPVVMDFGMAKVRRAVVSVVQSTTTGAGTVLGTPAFMPPEQTGIDLTGTGPYSDVYSLGAVLYALLTGRPPFDEGSALETILKVRSPEPPPPVRLLRPEVPDALAQICQKCLAKQPADRYPGVRPLMEDLRRCQTVAGVLQPAAAPAVANLVTFVVDLSTGAQFFLTGGAILVGRASQSDIVVPVPEVSRRHCRIVLDGGQAELEDLESVRGTWVNGRRVNRCRLHDGDRIEIGRRILQFRQSMG
jgi:hypothetical protein